MNPLAIVRDGSRVTRGQFDRELTRLLDCKTEVTVFPSATDRAYFLSGRQDCEILYSKPVPTSPDFTARRVADMASIWLALKRVGVADRLKPVTGPKRFEVLGRVFGVSARTVELWETEPALGMDPRQVSQLAWLLDISMAELCQ